MGVKVTKIMYCDNCCTRHKVTALEETFLHKKPKCPKCGASLSLYKSFDINYK